MPEAVIYISFNPAYNSIRYWTRDAAERARLEQETGALATPFFATPALTASHLKVVHDLIELSRRVHLALDGSEEQQGPNGRQHALDSQHFDDLCEALDCLEDLPDDKPGVTMGPSGKAGWALRQVLVPDGGMEAELQALRKKVATYEARDALGLVPHPPGELGPDGKEWAKTVAGYAHVEAMLPRADGEGLGPFWYGWALRGAFVAGAEWQEARRQLAQQAPHPDDAAVDRFAAAMKAKLASARAKGRGGWEDKDLCHQDSLALDLRRHVHKGDPVDVANFAMMLHQRGESTKLRPLSQDLVDAIKNAPVGAEVIEHNGHPIFITRASEDGAPMLGLMESNHKELQAQVVRTANLAGEIELRMCNGAEVPRDLESGMVVDVLYTPASSEGSTT